MDDDKFFNDFCGELNDIVNILFNLWEKIFKIIWKILRSLSESFQLKVTMVEESKDVDTLKLNEMIGNLQLIW